MNALGRQDFIEACINKGLTIRKVTQEDGTETLMGAVISVGENSTPEHKSLNMNFVTFWQNDVISDPKNMLGLREEISQYSYAMSVHGV
jgi:hypothetical protein